MPFPRKANRVLSEEKFVRTLQETENNLLHLALGPGPKFSDIQAATERIFDEAVEEKMPVMTILYENIINGKIFPERAKVVQEKPKIVAEKEFSLLEVAQHDSMSDCWIVIYDRVYDITKFLNSHPGGYDVIMEHAGRDATFAFRGAGHSSEAVAMLKKFEIGILPMEERLYRHETPIFRWGELPE